MSDWDKLKKQNEPQGREIMGTYRCQFCDAFVFHATYFPIDEVLKYRCSEDHLNFLENFKVAF